MWNRLVAAGIAAAAFTTTPPPSTATPLPETSVPLASELFTGMRSCNGVGNAFMLQSATLFPNPPRVGRPLTVRVTGSPSKTILPGSTMTLKMLIGVFEVRSATFDLCGLGMFTCPREPGVATFEQRFMVPQDMPIHVGIGTVVEAKNPDGSPILCVDGTLTFTP